MIYRPSPNYSLRKESRIIDSIILHYTDMLTPEEALNRLSDPIYQVSAHYLIDEIGQTYQLVEENYCAFHAGVSFWRGQDQINHSSIGIELANLGHSHGYSPFPITQMEALIILCKEIQKRHPSIEARNVIGHSDVAPMRKQDPGEYFNWQFLAKNGIGVWPKIGKYISKNKILLRVNDKGENVISLKERLSNYGYFTENTSFFDKALLFTVIAFKRHFLPHMINTIHENCWTLEDSEMLNALQIEIKG